MSNFTSDVIFRAQGDLDTTVFHCSLRFSSAFLWKDLDPYSDNAGDTRRLSIYEAAIRTNGAKMDKFRKNGQIHAKMDKLINSGQIKVSFVRISAPLSGFAQICQFFRSSIRAEGFPLLQCIAVMCTAQNQPKEAPVISIPFYIYFKNSKSKLNVH